MIRLLLVLLLISTPVELTTLEVDQLRVWWDSPIRGFRVDKTHRWDLPLIVQEANRKQLDTMPNSVLPPLKTRLPASIPTSTPPLLFQGDL